MSLPTSSDDGGMEIAADVVRMLEGQRAAAMARAEQAESALRKIAGHFIDGKRMTYASPDDTLDMIRAEAAAGLLGCDCLGTPDQENCPHE